MKIACLGWGSLIWRPDSLLIQRHWFLDGPMLPIEYVRQSNDGRLTLVITDDVTPVRTLWALMATQDLSIAKESLRVREGVPNTRAQATIISISLSEKTTDKTKLVIQNWAKSTGLDAVIWTGLPAKFNGTDGLKPTLNEAISYMQSIDVNTRSTAEEYIRRTPKQIDTEFRRKFETELGWTFKE